MNNAALTQSDLPSQSLNHITLDFADNFRKKLGLTRSELSMSDLEGMFLASNRD